MEWDLGHGKGNQDKLVGQPGPRDSPRDQGTETMTSSPPDAQNPSPNHSSRTGRAWAIPGRGYQLPSSLPSCPQPAASLTMAGTARVGPGLRQQVEKHIAQESPQGKAEQLLQAPGPSYKAEIWGLEAAPPGPLAQPLPHPAF